MWIKKEIEPTFVELARLRTDLSKRLLQSELKRFQFSTLDIDEIVLFVTSYGDFHIKRVANTGNFSDFKVKKIIYNEKIFEKKPPIIWDEIGTYPGKLPDPIMEHFNNAYCYTRETTQEQKEAEVLETLQAFMEGDNE